MWSVFSSDFLAKFSQISDSPRSFFNPLVTNLMFGDFYADSEQLLFTPQRCMSSVWNISLRMYVVVSQQQIISNVYDFGLAH